MLNSEVQNKIRQHCLSKSNQESCGLILNDDTVVLCNNIAVDPVSSFIIDPNDVSKYDWKDIKAFYHSHLHNNIFTVGDIAFSEKTNKTYVIYDISTDSFNYYHPNGNKIPYINRPFFLGKLDCCTLVQDYYKFQLNIQISDIEHSEKYSNNWENLSYNEHKDVLKNWLIQNKFSIVTDLKLHDVILVSLPKIKFPIHAGIYLDNNTILHHLYEFSTIENYKNSYKKFTIHKLRHESMI